MKNLTVSSILTKKSQITLPKPIREFLGVRPGGRVAFVIEGNAVKIIPVRSKLEENFGKIKPTRRPEDFKQIREVVAEEIGKEVMEELK
jgi:AbrB family looped-hinge helix DNA binding protein